MLARWRWVAAGLSVFAITVAVAPAQDKDKPALSVDQQFVMDAAMGGMFEMRMGKLAVDRSSDEEIKKFGERLLNDHTNANKALMEIAPKKGFNIPNAFDEKHQKEMDKFAKMEPGDFDREYIKAMVADHKEDASKFRMAAREVKDPDVRAFAQRTLPTIELHLKMAEDIAARLK